MKRTFFITILLIFALSLTLAACGGDDEPAPEPTEAPAVEEPAEEPAAEPAAEEPAEEPAAEPMEAAFPYPPGGFLEQAMNGDFCRHFGHSGWPLC